MSYKGGKGDYETVDTRLHKFYEKYPQGRVITELVEHTDKQWIVKASVFRDTTSDVAATGYAWEVTGSTFVNETNPLENCETSAVGRALANLGLSPKGARPSQEEMKTAERIRNENATELDAVTELMRDADSLEALEAVKVRVQELRVNPASLSGLRSLYAKKKKEFEDAVS